MSRDDKRIRKWRSAGTLGELYLKEMAEQGLLLKKEEMTPLKYIFREDEPQHLRYRIEELEHAPTDEERGGICEGWLAGGTPPVRVGLCFCKGMQCG